jgi:hypothetical protein
MWEPLTARPFPPCKNPALRKSTIREIPITDLTTRSTFLIFVAFSCSLRLSACQSD